MVRAGSSTTWVWYTHFETEFGWMGLLGSVAGLCRIVLPQPSQQAVLHLLVQGLPGAIADPAPFGDLPHRLRRYFSGEQVPFADELDLADATPFKRAVWLATRIIPYGEIRSYSWVAHQIGSPESLRAVGQALARNPFPIIVPCHRVLGKDGNLRGFGGGLEMKKRLLELESCSL
jgi:methylated-DNA-[protein]-cysteine S-methyltransferase